MFWNCMEGKKVKTHEFRLYCIYTVFNFFQNKEMRMIKHNTLRLEVFNIEYFYG